MSHHASELKDEMLQAALRGSLGATGKFPRGKINRLDEGEIKFAIAADHATQTELLNFGKPVVWMGMTGEEAIDLGNILRDKGLEINIGSSS